MQIEHLYYLKTVIECKSISLAAEKLFISQQSLSDIIRKLEKTLTVDLLHRSNKGVTLTLAGEKALPQIYALLADYELLLKTTSAQEESTTELKLLNNKFINGNYFSEIVSIFTDSLPQVHLHIAEELDPEVLLKTVIDNRVDLGICPCSLVFLASNPLLLKHLNKSLVINEIFLDHLYVIVNYDSPLRTQGYATIDDVYNYPLVLNNHSYFQRTLQEVYPDRKLNIFFNTSNPHSQLQAIQDNLGIGITPGLATLRNDLNEFVNVRTIPLMDAELKVIAFIPISKANNTVVTQFIDIFRSVLLKKTAALPKPIFP